MVIGDNGQNMEHVIEHVVLEIVKEHDNVTIQNLRMMVISVLDQIMKLWLDVIPIHVPVSL